MTDYDYQTHYESNQEGFILSSMFRCLVSASDNNHAAGPESSFTLTTYHI